MHREWIETINSVAFNYIMNFLMKASGAFFSFISYPYAFRVIGAEQMGRISFVQSFSTLFAMIAALGIPIYGVRECAKVRDNPQALSKTTSELLTVQVSVTALSLIGYALVVCIFLKPQSAQWLFIIQGISIFLNAINLEWLYSAKEEFGYIAARTIVIKVIMTCLIFLIVSNKANYLYYALILVSAPVVSSCINLYCMLRSTWIAPLHYSKDWKQHIAPILIFFIQTVSITVYTNMDSVMLGFFKGNYEVGIYDAAIKIKLILSYFVTSLSTVLLPKLSFYVAKGYHTKLREIISKTIQFSVLISFPIIIFFGIMADETMEIVCGMQVPEGERLLQILLPTVLLIGCSSLIGNQILTPLKKEKIAVTAYVFGAIVNVILNFFLIPQWSVIGAAVATLIAEVTVVIVEVWHLRLEFLGLFKEISLKIPIVAALFPVPVLIFTKDRFLWLPAQLLFSSVVYGFVWVVLLAVLKEPFLRSRIKKLMKIVRK